MMKQKNIFLSQITINEMVLHLQITYTVYQSVADFFFIKTMYK